MRKITLFGLALLCLLSALLLTGCGDSKELVIEEGVTGNHLILNVFLQTLIHG